MVSIAVLTTAQTRGSHSLSAAAHATTAEWMVSISFANFIHFALLVELFYEYIVVRFHPNRTATQLRLSVCIEVYVVRHICRDCKKPLALPLLSLFQQ